MDENIYTKDQLEPNEYDDICIWCMMQHGGLCPFEIYDWTLNWDFDCQILIKSVCD